jgi:hypothetical protein
MWPSSHGTVASVLIRIRRRLAKHCFFRVRGLTPLLLKKPQLCMVQQLFIRSRNQTPQRLVLDWNLLTTEITNQPLLHLEPCIGTLCRQFIR